MNNRYTRLYHNNTPCAPNALSIDQPRSGQLAQLTHALPRASSWLIRRSRSLSLMRQNRLFYFSLLALYFVPKTVLSELQLCYQEIHTARERTRGTPRLAKKQSRRRMC